MGVEEQGEEINVQSMIEQLSQAFLELEAQKGETENKIQWVEIKQHFHDLETELNKKLEELEAKEREYEAKQVEVDTLLAERKTVIASKEQDLLDRLQELKDAAVASIVEAHANHRNATLESVYDGENKDNKGMRKSCIIILEAMATLLARADPGADHLLNPQTKQHAKAIADEWRPNLARADTDAANGNSLEAKAFFQLISTFKIASEFDEEELCKLVLAVAQLRQAPELCCSIGLIHKMPAVVESLINTGKQIAAVHFIHAFQLQESFPPVPLLKAYLKNRRRNSQVKTGNVRDITSAKNDANAQELAALRAVIKCIEEYKLESDYPPDTLRKRVLQLEKSKGDRKRSGEFIKRPQSKRPRPNERRFSLHSSGGSVASTVILGRQVPPVRAPYAANPDRYPHDGTITYDYQVPGQSIYTAASNAPPSNYGRYMGTSTSLQSSHQPYL
ncbi:hypothetical protein AAZX31_05G094300 [Glycine max]